MKIVKTAIVSSIGIASLACSSSNPSPAPAPAAPATSTSTGTDAAPSWDEVAAVISANCAKCHNGTIEPSLTPLATFLASPVEAMLTSGQMPPSPNVISASDKQTLLSFIAAQAP